MSGQVFVADEMRYIAASSFVSLESQSLVKNEKRNVLHHRWVVQGSSIGSASS